MSSDGVGTTYYCCLLGRDNVYWVTTLRTNVSTRIHDVTSQKTVILILKTATNLKCHILAETLWLQILYSIICDGKHGTVLPVVATTRCFYSTEQVQASTTVHCILFAWNISSHLCFYCGLQDVHTYRIVFLF
jgi:hypothetical protein